MLKHTTLLILLVLVVVSTCTPLPPNRVSKQYHNRKNHLDVNSAESSEEKTVWDVEKSLEHFLNAYYNKFVKNEVEEKLSQMVQEKEETSMAPEDIYDRMQGDQPTAPVTETNIRHQLFGMIANATNNKKNNTEAEYFKTMRDRTKEMWMQILKNKILQQIGRENMTTSVSRSTPDDPRFTAMNITDIMPNFLNTTVLNDDQITEKIRSFYPSCEIPANTDQDLWKDDSVMNLYFSFDYNSDEKTANIATATLRLYRLPAENSTNIKTGDCDYNTTEEEKLIRVSIYWYTKSLKKRRAVKRRLSDSKVIPENSRWVELCVKPATKAWSKARNLGLGITVEDQDGNPLKAEKYFKGASCMVGASTPKPIPTIIVDAARKTNELNQIHSLFGRNSTSTVYSDLQLLPIIDICTLEFPENYTQSSSHLNSLRVNACNLKKNHDQSQKLAEKDRLERLVTLPGLLVPSSTRHIRHQRQHLASKLSNEDSDGGSADFDPRSRMVNSRVVFTNEQLQQIQSQLNFTTINR